MRYVIGCLAFIVMAFPAGNAFPSDFDRCEEIRARLDELTREVEAMSDISALMQIQQELAELNLEYMEKCMGAGGGGVSFSREMVSPAPTPEKEIKRRRDLINKQWRQFNRHTELLKSDDQEVLVPVKRAVPIKGLVIIDGQYRSKPYRGLVSHEIAYRVTESFVGNLLVTSYFNTRTGRYTDMEDYEFDTLSTGINVEALSGRYCVEATAGSCMDWESFETYEVDQSEIYPGSYDRVVAGQTEDGKVILRTISPVVVFRSLNGRAGDRLGCFGARQVYPTSEFKRFIEQGGVQFVREVGSESDATPGCSTGSTISLELAVEQPLDPPVE